MTTSDDGLREIQLNGKQLVFLFMAVTVVSVVIFLCGVLVGRGVPDRVQAVEPPAVQETETPADASATAPSTPPSGPTKADDLGYPTRLTGVGPDSERLISPSDPPKKAPALPATAAPVVPAATATPPRPASADAAPSAAKADIGTAKPIPAEPQGDGIAIQVAAVRGRGEADALMARLKSKGYAAYLVASLPGQPAGFRVRVGKFKTRTEAEKVATRLEREEQFKPWITR